MAPRGEPMGSCQGPAITGVCVKVAGVIDNVPMSLLFFRASFMTKTVPCGNELHKFLIWDTAGQERVRTGCCWLLGETMPNSTGFFVSGKTW